MMGCLDDGQILALVSGTLAPDALAVVDDHIDSCAMCRELVLAVAQGSAGVTVAFAAGARVGRYTVEEEIGRGSFGVVYRAYDPELERHVALKWLGDDARTAREARAMAQLGHPNVVTIYEVGKAGPDTFLALELVDGETLSAWLQAPRTRSDKLAVLLGAGAGLAAAHAAGIVHRDVKPANIMVGADGRARVTDFGMARRDDEALGGHDPDAAVDELTASGMLLGTPAYMAPEQLAGGHATPASDQFSFCVVVYEALTGRRPFMGGTLAALRSAMAARVADDRAIPRWMQRVIARGLAPEPAARYPSMTALISALGRDPTLRRVLASVVVAALAAGAALAFASKPSDPCAGGAALAYDTWNEARAMAVRTAFITSAPHFSDVSLRAVEDALARWRDSWAEVHGELCRAAVTSEARERQRTQCLDGQRRDVEALVLAFEHADETAVLRAADAVAQMDPPARCLDLTATPAPHAPQAERLASFGPGVADVRAQLAVGHFEAARDGSAALVALAIDVDFDPAKHEAYALRAEAELQLGALNEAEADGEAALEAAERSGNQRQIVKSWLRLAAIDGTRGLYRDADKHCRHAEALLHRLAGDATLRAQALNARGVIDTNLGRHDTAEVALIEALELRSGEHGEQHVEVARTLTNLGNLGRERGDLDAARRFHLRAQAIDAALLGADHPDAARHDHNLARVELLRGHAVEAEALYRRTLSRLERTVGKDHPANGLTYNSLGLLYEGEGDDARAAEHFQLAIERLLPTRPGDATAAMVNLGNLALRRGDANAALAQLEPALELISSLMGPEHERVAEVALSIARALAARGDVDASRTALAKVIAVAMHSPEADKWGAEARALLEPASQPKAKAVVGAPPSPSAAPPGGAYVSGQSWD